jgi:flagellar hook assembly protein FlgD
VRLTIHDAKGQLVATVVNEERIAGEHMGIWNGRSGSGSTVASGIYIVRLATAEGVKTSKLVLLK